VRKKKKQTKQRRKERRKSNDEDDEKAESWRWGGAAILGSRPRREGFWQRESGKKP
jgi:hypothetical protein